MSEEPTSILVYGPVGRHGETESYQVGLEGVTRIEPYFEGGLHCDLPYFRVWMGDKIHAEFCKHGIIGVY